MHTGMGTEIPFLNERCKALCAKQGILIKALGVSGTREVVDHLRESGCRVEWIRDRWQWMARIRLDATLDCVKPCTYSLTAFAPDDIHSMAIERLEAEWGQQLGGLDTEVEVPN